MDLVQKSINAIQQAASNLGKRVTSNFGWAGQQAQRTFTNYQNQVNENKKYPFFNQSNTPSQWVGRVIADTRKRGLIEGMQDLSNPILMNPYIEPIAEPLVSAFRVGKYKLGQQAQQNIVRPIQQGLNNYQQFVNNAAVNPNPVINTIPREAISAGTAWSDYARQPTFQNLERAKLRTIQPIAKVALAPLTGLSTYIGSAALGGTFAGGAKAVENIQTNKPIMKDVGREAFYGAQQGIVQAPIIGAISRVTNPAIAQSSMKVISKLPAQVQNKLSERGADIVNRVIQGTLSIPEGKVMAESLGKEYTAVDAAIDFAIGSGMATKVGSGIRAKFKPMTPEQKVFQQQGFAKIASDVKAPEVVKVPEVKAETEIKPGESFGDWQRRIEAQNRPLLTEMNDTLGSGRWEDAQSVVDRMKLEPEKYSGYIQNLQNTLEMMKKADPNKPLSTIADVEKVIYKSQTPEKLGGEKTGAGVISNFLRNVENNVSEFVRQGELHPNPYIRNFTRVLQGFSGGMGKSRQQMETTGRFKGTGINYANQIAVDAREMATKLLDNPVKSLERIHAVLHPDFSDIKVSEAELTKPELEVLNLHRVIADYTNDTNYKNGFISKETWEKNRGGKYATNIYDEFEYPTEMSDIVQHSNLKPYEGLYKAKTEVTDWKKEHVIRDPIAAISKRMNQTIFNDELSRMMNAMAKTQDISAVERPGYVKLSDSPFYGDASGKWIRKTALDDIRGQFFTNKMADNAYRLIDAYDKNPLRQLQKKILTIFNPGVQMGNAGSNYIFSAISGIDPVTFSKNQVWANSEFDSKGPIFRKAMQDGIIGTDILRGDIIKSQSELEASIKDPNIVKKLLSLPEYAYGKVDDLAKLSSLKTWLDRGYTWEEAARRTYNSYQNYRHVGWMYNVGAKLPLVGNPFVRFAGDMVRIAKNAAIDHPVALVSTIGMWKVFTDIMSTASGETPEERKLRENRFGSAHVPLTDISLAVQTPWGEVNIARLVGASAYMTDGTQALNDLMRFSPVQNPLDPAKWSDPILSPVAQTIMDKDFRGKSIADPNQNKYRESSLTPMEQNINRAKFLARAYVPKLSEAMDITSAAKGEKDFYGRVKSLPQQLLRTTTGIKVEKYGPEQVQEQIDKDLQYKEGQTLGINKRINTVVKDMLSGNIDESIGQDRVKYLETLKPKQEGKELLVNDGVIWRGDKVQFQKTDGTLDSYDFSKWNTVPTNNIQAIKQKYDAIKFANTIMENENLTESQKAQLISRLPVKEQDVIYYNNASMPAEIKELMIQEEIQNLINQGKADLIPQYLASQRQSVAGKMMLTDTLLNKLASDGQISYSLRDAVKNTTVDEKGNFTQKIKVSKPKSFKMKKVTIPKIKAVKATKSSKLKSVKVPKFKALKVPKIGKIKAK